MGHPVGTQRWTSSVSSVHAPKDGKPQVLFRYPSLKRFRISTAFGETQAWERFALYLITTETLNQKEAEENARHARSPEQRNWGSFSVHRSTARDITPAGMPSGGLNVISLGPFGNTEHPHCSGGCSILQRGPSERIPWESGLTLTCFPDSVGQLKYSNSLVSRG